MTFDAASLSVREAAAQAARHAHPAPRAELRLTWLRFYVYLAVHDHRFTDWPSPERVGR